MSPGDAGLAGCQTDEMCPAGTLCDTTTNVCRSFCVGGLCGAGQTCSPEGLCVDAQTCTTAEECGADATCDCNGLCVAMTGSACRSDLSCETTSFCDMCSGQCRPRVDQCGVCTSDSQCDPRAVCVGVAVSGGASTGTGFCARQCQESCDVIGPGYSCEMVRDGVTACVPSAGACDAVSGCRVDADCPPDRFCNERLQCQPGCANDTGCPDGQLCQGLRCAPPCTGDMDCPAGQTCGEQGRCGVPGGCTTSADCPMAETYCDREQLMCVPGCEVDNDCLDANRECVAGTCRPRGCSGAYQCAFGQVCNLETTMCEDAMGAHCSEGCDPQSMDACGEPGSRCLSLQDMDGNPIGDFCFEPCGMEPNQCPKGYNCTELMDENGMGMGSLCVRDCTYQVSQ